MGEWYRATDKWLRQSRGDLVAKPGTKWHLVDVGASSASRVVAACDRYLSEARDEALLEMPTRIKPGQTVPTPGRGATCSRCYKRALA